MRKLFFYDLETTGVNYRRNGIHQISGSIDIDGEIRKNFDFKVRPNPQAIIDDAALEIGGVTREQIMAYPPMEEVYKQMIDMISVFVNRFDKTDKFFLVGYNNRSFDDQFLRAWFVQNHDDYFGSYFWSDSQDVLCLASRRLMNERNRMENFKLKTVAKQIGLDVDETRLHDAAYDIDLTRTLYYKI